MNENPNLLQPGATALNFGGAAFQLLPERAIFSPGLNSLILSDVHLGKGTAFRAAGLPVPSGSSAKDLKRITTLLNATRANRLFILGDLIHARKSHQEELSAVIHTWRRSHRDIEMLLIRGNHDRHAGRLPDEWEISEVEQPYDLTETIVLSHEPNPTAGKSTLAGHIHPVFALRDFDGSTIKAPCFVIDADSCLTLPAFGSFTGGYRVDQAPERKIFVTSGRAVLAVANNAPK